MSPFFSFVPIFTSMLENDSNTLREQYRNGKDAKEKVRYATLYAVSRCFSVAEVAKFVDVEEPTAYDWIKKKVTEEDVSDKPRVFISIFIEYLNYHKKMVR